MKRLLLPLLAALSLGTASLNTHDAGASAQVYNLATDPRYLLDWTDTLRLSSIYNAGADTVTMKTRFPDFIAWCKANYLTKFGRAGIAGGFWGSFRQLREFDACYNDAVWRAHPVSYTLACQSRSDILVPPGRFKVNFPLMIAHGRYVGAGSSRFYANGSNPQGSTELVIDRTWWCGPSVAAGTSYNCMQSNTWGDNSAYGYDESAYIGSFRLVGDMVNWTNPTYHSSGIAIWDAGETQMVENCYLDFWNDHGIELVRGTPATVINCSMFTNGRYGICGVGGALNTYRIYGPSGDGNGLALVGSIDDYEYPGANRVAGGNWTISGAKVETYGDPNTVGAPGKPQMVFEGFGYVNVNIVGGRIGMHANYLDALVHIDSLVNTCTVNMSGFSGYQFFYALQVQGKRYSIPDQIFGGITFVYSSANGGQIWCPFGTATVNSSNCRAHLNILQDDDITGQPVGSFDYTNCTPTYSVNGPGSSTCVYTYTDWGPCTSGTHTRSVINVTPPVCTGSPILSESCTAPTIQWSSSFNSGTLASIPAQTHTIGPTNLVQSTSTMQASSLSGGILTVTGSKPGARYPLAFTGLRQITIFGFKATALNGGYLFDNVQLGSNGLFTCTVPGVTVTCTQTPITLNTLYTGAINIYFSAPINTTNLFNPTSVVTPNAQQCQMDLLRLYNAY